MKIGMIVKGASKGCDIPTLKFVECYIAHDYYLLLIVILALNFMVKISLLSRCPSISQPNLSWSITPSYDMNYI